VCLIGSSGEASAEAEQTRSRHGVVVGVAAHACMHGCVGKKKRQSNPCIDWNCLLYLQVQDETILSSIIFLLSLLLYFRCLREF